MKHTILNMTKLKNEKTKDLFCLELKELSRKLTQKIPINDVDGKPLKSFEEQSNRWKVHFQAILNCPEPDNIHDFGDLHGDELNIKEGEIHPRRGVPCNQENEEWRSTRN